MKKMESFARRLVLTFYFLILQLLLIHNISKWEDFSWLLLWVFMTTKF